MDKRNTIIVWAEHSSKAGTTVALPAEQWDDYEPRDDHVEIEVTMDELARHEAMKTIYGWRVASLLESYLGLEVDENDPE